MKFLILVADWCFSGCFLCVIVERAKKCLDFTATTHLIHLCCTVMYDGFPGSWEWWVVNFVSVVVMALLGEFLCMRRELQALSRMLGSYSAINFIQLQLFVLHRIFPSSAPIGSSVLTDIGPSRSTSLAYGMNCLSFINRTLLSRVSHPFSKVDV